MVAELTLSGRDLSMRGRSSPNRTAVGQYQAVETNETAAVEQPFTAWGKGRGCEMWRK
jgi:hypothetical protein